MKHTQGAYLSGYVTLLIKGERPELFFRACMNEGMIVWNIKKISIDECQGNIKWRDLRTIEQMNLHTRYQLSVMDKKGIPFIFQRLLKRREVILAFCLCLIFILFLSNVLWKITITGVPKEMEEKISEQLVHYGVHPGSWMFSLDSPSEIQQKLINDLPELLWVGVQKKGTTLTLEGVEKATVEKEVVPGPRHLVATKKGVIKKIYVTKGQPKVGINDFVEPGDILVSGVLHEMEESSSESKDDDSSTDKLNLVASKAEITAQTWYEINVSIPLTTKQEMLTGNQEKKFYLRFGNIQLPTWNFRTPNFESFHQEMNENDVFLLKWKLPIQMVESILSEKVYNEIVRTKEEAIQIGLLQAKRDLLLKLGTEAQIISENILQDTVENGKVNLRLYVTVEEDISKAESISQGD